MTTLHPGIVLQTGGGIIPRGSRVFVFNQIFDVFLLLGAAVGVVVISYMLYNAYRYRAGADAPRDLDETTLGDLPRGGGGGRKLALSFAMSTIIVVSVVAWTYGTLLFVEQDSPAASEDALEVEVVGYQFGWEFVYPNGESTRNTLRVPEDRPVRLEVTSRDVFHTFGVPGLRVKTDAIPGQTTATWFIGEETGDYAAQCYELCGVGHSKMSGTVVVMEPDAYQEWYASMGEENSSSQSAVATRGVGA